jgi:MATE family multidrug resistance protein
VLFKVLKKEYVIILQLGLPILIGQLGAIATGFADNIMIGHYSTEALASASFCNNVFNMAIFACVGFSYGVTPLVGALFAKGEGTRIGQIMRAASLINTIFCILVMAIMTVIYLNLEHMGQPEELLPIIRPYYLTNIIGMLPIALFNVFAQWSYAINNTRLPMWIVLGGNLLNVIGNYVLIFGHFGFPELGLLGAGISTFIARAVGPIVIIAVFLTSRSYSQYSNGFKTTRSTSDISRQIWRTSLPISLQMTFETAAFSIAAVMCGMLGKIPLAAYQIIIITGTLGFCIYYSIGAAVSVRVANAKGREDNGAMRRSAWAGYHILLIIMCMSSLTFVLFGKQIMSIFTDDAAVLTCAVSLIPPLVLYQLGDATQINFASALRGTANVTPMLWIAFFSYMIIGVPATYALCFPAGMGIYGIVLSFSVSLFTAAALFLYNFMRSTR